MGSNNGKRWTEAEKEKLWEYANTGQPTSHKDANELIFVKLSECKGDWEYSKVIRKLDEMFNRNLSPGSWRKLVQDIGRDKAKEAKIKGEQLEIKPKAKIPKMAKEEKQVDMDLLKELASENMINLIKYVLCQKTVIDIAVERLKSRDWPALAESLKNGETIEQYARRRLLAVKK